MIEGGPLPDGKEATFSWRDETEEARPEEYDGVEQIDDALPATTAEGSSGDGGKDGNGQWYH